MATPITQVNEEAVEGFGERVAASQPQLWLHGDVARVTTCSAFCIFFFKFYFQESRIEDLLDFFFPEKSPNADFRKPEPC